MLRKAVVAALLAGAAAQAADEVCTTGACAETVDEETSLLGLRRAAVAPHVPAGSLAQAEHATKKYDTVACPYSGVSCAGNQCCPATAETGYTFPCPSADAGWNDCESNQAQPQPQPQPYYPPEVPVTGGDRDQYGCLGSAGYVYCPSVQTCGQPWVNSCPGGYVGEQPETPVVGGNTDSYGCSLDGGFKWCPSAQQCGQPWVNSCPGGYEGEQPEPYPQPQPQPYPYYPEPTPRQATCPYSGAACAGNQCCPGTVESGSRTFPCPGADYGWNGCETGQASPQPQPQPQPASSVSCPYSGNACAGNQCCPGTVESGSRTFPCPTADYGWNGCETGKVALPQLVQKKKVALPPLTQKKQAALAQLSQKQVACPFSGNACSGNQCCPGTSETNGKTFPCPNAQANWNDCQGPRVAPAGWSCNPSLPPQAATTCASGLECVFPLYAVQNKVVGGAGTCQSTTTGGSCTVFGCDSSRGPTTCVRGPLGAGTCKCQPGYRAANGVCVAQP